MICRDANRPQHWPCVLALFLCDNWPGDTVGDDDRWRFDGEAWVPLFECPF